jgi:WhiB family transcriptional regulator, redox-sensing transcriptional regulator
MIDPSSWRAHAKCRTENAAYFYAPSHFERKPEKDHREGIARALCRACPVQPQCLAYSLEVAESHGIWGGLNELERKRLLRRRKAEAEAAQEAETACPA